MRFSREERRDSSPGRVLAHRSLIVIELIARAPAAYSLDELARHVDLGPSRSLLGYIERPSCSPTTTGDEDATSSSSLSD